MLDLTPFLNDPKTAVHCSSVEQSNNFIQCMKEFDLRRTGTWTSAHWYDYEERTCYSPNFGGSRSYMTYCDIDYYKSSGYKIFEYKELCESVVDLTTELSDGLIDELLGI